MKRNYEVNLSAIVWILLFVCFGYASIKAVHAQKDTTYRKALYLTSGKADTVELPSNISDILVASPSIADVGVLRKNRLYVVGREVGDTNVLAFDDSGNVLAEISIHVRIDEETLRKTVSSFFPEEDVQVETVGGNIVLTGRVTTPAVANQVRDLAGRFRVDNGQEIVDLMKVAGEQQVLLKVRILEADRSLLRELGIGADYVSGDLSMQTSNALNLLGLTPFASGTMAIADGLSLDFQALEQDGLINTLAEPNLTAISGESAGFLAGGEFPVPTGVDNQGRISIEFKQFGVSLDFRPIVMSRDRISLQLATEVSALSEQDSVSLGIGINIPGLTVRRANTTVEMSSGSSLMIAGLLRSETTNALNGIPGISSIPVLGDLFKSKSFARDETELVVIVSPYLVTTFAEAQADNAADLLPAKNRRPLENRLVTTLSRVYGEKVNEAVGTSGAHFGYMIE